MQKSWKECAWSLLVAICPLSCAQKATNTWLAPALSCRWVSLMSVVPVLHFTVYTLMSMISFPGFVFTHCLSQLAVSWQQNQVLCFKNISYITSEEKLWLQIYAVLTLYTWAQRFECLFQAELLHTIAVANNDKSQHRSERERGRHGAHVHPRDHNPEDEARRVRPRREWFCIVRHETVSVSSERSFSLLSYCLSAPFPRHLLQRCQSSVCAHSRSRIQTSPQSMDCKVPCPKCCIHVHVQTCAALAQGLRTEWSNC